MTDFCGFKGAAVRLAPSDLAMIAEEAGIELPALRAVVTVEAAGSGFDSAGRPKILFEPHVFFRNLDPEYRAEAVAEGLAYPRWGQKPYPKGNDAQYERLVDAMEYDVEAALKSCSWGLGQIMGGNHKLVDFNDVEAMVLACMDSEAAQLRMMVAFIRNSGLLDEVRRRDWAEFARGYNGPGFAKNQYDVKLAQAYDRFAAMA